MIYLAAGAMVLFIVCALYIAWANLMSRANVVQCLGPKQPRYNSWKKAIMAVASLRTSTVKVIRSKQVTLRCTSLDYF